MKPIFNRRYGDWNEDELAMVMLMLEREYHKNKKRGPLPCDKLSDAENVVVLDVSKSKSPDHTTSTEMSDTSTLDTRSAKDALAMEDAKQMLRTMIKTEAREMLHKFRHTDPDFAQKLEQEFKDEGIL